MIDEPFTPDDCETPDAPPESGMPFVPIVRVGTNTTLEVQALQARPLGTLTHFVGRRTIPHRKDKRRCDGCRLKIGTRWRGYFYAKLLPVGKLCIAEITKEGFLASAELKDKSFNMLGYHMFIKRRGSKPNSPQVVEFGQKRPVPPRRELPELLEVLVHIWNGETELEDMPDAD